MKMWGVEIQYLCQLPSRTLRLRTAGIIFLGIAFLASCSSGDASSLTPVATQWSLSNRQYAETYVNQPFVGNGYLGLRIPSAGDGYWVGSKPPDNSSSWPLGTPRYTGALVAGFYGTHGYISALPNWSPLTIRDASGEYDPLTVAAGQISGYRQTTDMLHGVVTTSLVWTSPSGNRAKLVWHIFAHRKFMRLGVVRLDVTPLQWSGALRVDAFLDMRGIQRASELQNERREDLSANTAEASIASNGLNTKATVAFGVIAPPGLKASAIDNNVRYGLSWSLHPVPNKTYTFIKYVGVATAVDAGAADSTTKQNVNSQAVNQRARDAVAQAMRMSVSSGAIAAYDNLLESHEAAWRSIWQSDVIVDSRHEHLQAILHASEYMLYSNVRRGAHSSIAPAGLSSDNYAGMIFWDAETWMYPFLLATHPGMAKSIVDYRYEILPNALRNVQRDPQELRATQGSFYPWTSATGVLAIDGGESPEIHLQADIALSQFQYYEETGDKAWLRQYGWPVLKSIADYYSTRVTKNSDGSFSIVGVDGPDEFTTNATDAAYTNGSALRALDFAMQAAHLLGYPVPARWTLVREHLVRPKIDPQREIHLQYKGFDPAHPKVLKQADVVLLAYPMEYPMPARIAVNDLKFYSAITDPLGPSMTNSVQAIIAAQYKLHSLDKFFLDSYKPYIRGPYLNFNETAVLVPSARQWNPAYTFLTGTGGFLQVLLNGFGGFRFRQDAIYLAPTLTADAIEGSPLSRVYLKGLKWQGRIFDVDITPSHTTVLLTHGPGATVKTPAGSFTLYPGRELTLPTTDL